MADVEYHKEMYANLTLCEVCEKEQYAGVAAVPGIPISVRYCSTCLEANAHPWGILAGNAALCGGLDKTNESFQQMVNDTCKHLGRTLEEFNKDVERHLKNIEAYSGSSEF